MAESLLDAKPGDSLFMEYSNYAGTGIEKVTVVTASQHYITIKDRKGYTRKFNAKNGENTGREYGRSHMGDLRYELHRPTPELELQFVKQKKKGFCSRTIRKLSEIHIKDLSDEEVDRLYDRLLPLRDCTIMQES